MPIAADLPKRGRKNEADITLNQLSKCSLATAFCVSLQQLRVVHIHPIAPANFQTEPTIFAPCCLNRSRCMVNIALIRSSLYHLANEADLFGVARCPCDCSELFA